MATSNKDTFLAQVSPGASSFVQELKKFAAHADEIEYSLQIANRIMEIMDEQDISQKLLAEKMGVTAQYISKYLTGKTNFTLRTLVRFEKVLDAKLIEVTAQAVATS